MSSSKEPASASAGPGADQGTYRAMAEAVCQVGADGGGDACAEAPACQGWYRVLAPVASRVSMLAARIRLSTG